MDARLSVRGKQNAAVERGTIHNLMIYFCDFAGTGFPELPVPSGTRGNLFGNRIKQAAFQKVAWNDLFPEAGPEVGNSCPDELLFSRFRSR